MNLSLHTAKGLLKWDALAIHFLRYTTNSNEVTRYMVFEKRRLPHFSFGFLPFP
jgi:hypothetical protein